MMQLKLYWTDWLMIAIVSMAIIISVVSYVRMQRVVTQMEAVEPRSNP